jgi:hypothetical protein
MGLLLLGMLVLTALAVSFVVLVAIKAVLWVVLLPIRLVLHAVFGVLFLPFLLLKFLVGGLVMLIVGPVLFVGLIAGLIGLAVPLFPLLCIAFVIWVVMRSSRTTAIART